MKKIITLFAVAILSATFFICSKLISDKPVVYLMGDSTCAQKLEEKRPETGWGEKIANYFSDGVIFSNHAKNGRSTRTFISEGRWDSIYRDLKSGDYVFIQFGHNDASESKVERYTPPTDFKANLTMFVEKVRSKGATPVLLTPVCRRKFVDNNFQDSHGTYGNLTREVAKATGTTLLDAHLATMGLLIKLGAEKSRELFLQCKPGECPNYPGGIEDNTHSNDYGANVTAGLIAEEIGKSALPLKGFLK